MGRYLDCLASRSWFQVPDPVTGAWTTKRTTAAAKEATATKPPELASKRGHTFLTHFFFTSFRLSCCLLNLSSFSSYHTCFFFFHFFSLFSLCFATLFCLFKKSLFNISSFQLLLRYVCVALDDLNSSLCLSLSRALMHSPTHPSTR